MHCKGVWIPLKCTSDRLPKVARGVGWVKNQPGSESGPCGARQMWSLVAPCDEASEVRLAVSPRGSSPESRHGWPSWVSQGCLPLNCSIPLSAQVGSCVSCFSRLFLEMRQKPRSCSYDCFVPNPHPRRTQATSLLGSSVVLPLLQTCRRWP